MELFDCVETPFDVLADDEKLFSAASCSPLTIAGPLPFPFA